MKTEAGRKELFQEEMRMIPGAEIVEAAGNIVLHPLNTWNGIKDHYEQAAQTDEGRGKILFPDPF